MIKKTIFTVFFMLVVVFAAAGQTIQQIKNDPGNNNPPPIGAILDLNGTLIPAGGLANSTYQEYSVQFVAGVTSTAITFAIREDPAFISLANVSVVDLTTGGETNLLTNGDFSGGACTSNGNTETPCGWTYSNQYGAYAGGILESGSSYCYTYAYCWYDGAVQAYDALSQSIPTNIGDTYSITFWVADNSGCSTEPAGPPCNFSDLSTNGDVTDTGGNGINVTVYAQASLPAGSQQTGQPLNPNNPANLAQPFVFNNASNNHVEYDFDYTTAFNTGTDLTIQPNTVPTVNNQGVTQATYQQLVAGTSLATTQCFIAPGEGTDSNGNSLCAQFTLECTNQNQPTPQGDACPQSTQRNILFTHVLDISPPLTTLPPGTAPSMAEGSDTWSPGNCVFEGPETGNLCPQSLLTQFFATGPDPIPGGTGKTSNSTFIAGCCEPEWTTVPTVPLYYNNTTVPVSFTSSPPADPLPPTSDNGWVAAPNQSITWGWENFGATPDPTYPITGDQTVTNATACPSSWPAHGVTPPNATASGTVTVPSEGQFEVHFFSTACDDQEELQFTVQTDTTKNWAAFKTAPFNVDTTKPQVSSVVLNPPGGSYAQNSSVTATVTCTDPASSTSTPPGYFTGIAQCGQQGSPQIFGNQQTVVTTPITLNTATVGTQTFMAFAQDAAGNFVTSPVTYTVVGASADLAEGMIGNILIKSGTNMTYLIFVANKGPNAAQSVAVTDTLPAGTTFVSSGYAIESCSFSGGRPNCHISPPTNSCGSVPGTCSIGTLAAWTPKNPIGVLVQITVRVTASPGTRIKNTATASEANSDPNLNNNTAFWYTLVTH